MSSPWRAGLVGLAIALAACGSTAPASPPALPATHPTAPSAAPLSYAALGASETFGSGATPITNGYAYRVRDRLRLGSGTFIDVGVPGVTAAEAYRLEVAGALSIRPTVCTAFFGVNDVRRGVPLARFTSDLTELATALRQGGCHVLIVGLPVLQDLPALRRVGIPGLTDLTSRWNAAIAQVAAATGSAFLALDQLSEEVLTHPDLISPDGLHPSNAGHAKLSEVMVAALRQDGYVPG